MVQTESNVTQALSGFAQGIRCGDLALALPYGWSRMVVDEYSLTPVPRAPIWLAGAASINGTVTPVVDLQLFVRGTNAAVESGAWHKRRLLVGGAADTEANKTLGILFDDLPTQIELGNEFVTGVSPEFSQFGNALTGQVLRLRDTAYRMLAPETLYEVLTSHLSRH